ncbi:hypothetical protein LTR53_009649 [Teratosphaeriaceae sp. CCFEE 6253]|nr:hypothetical protein LTR53_009649 [Teratosphaeriaceae sp. CCFEE 6253]
MYHAAAKIANGSSDEARMLVLAKQWIRCAEECEKGSIENAEPVYQMIYSALIGDSAITA